jgi:hypothetical protein
MNSTLAARLSAIATLVTLTSCSGGGGAPTGEVSASGSFVVLRTMPLNAGTSYLNDPVRIDFSNRVDLDSATLDAVAFQVIDALGNAVAEHVSGQFSLAPSADGRPERQLLFVPSLPTADDYGDGGFRPGRTYLVQLVGGERHTGTVLRDRDGKVLLQPVSFSFSTVEGTLAAQLFRNPRAGGPRRASVDGLTIGTASDLGAVPLNLQGAPPVEVRLKFDQALNPQRSNIPVALDTNPLVRSEAARGRVFLEYDDPELGPDTWIPADVELEENGLDGSVLVLRPVGVLPNNAEIRVIVEPVLEDIAGESNSGELNYNRVFGAFHTQAAYGQQFDALVENFDSAAAIDFAAVFAEPLAEVGHGYIRAGFAFEGSPTTIEFEPQAQEVVMNTDFTQVVPKDGPAFNVGGGIFNFRNVHIPQGVTVRGQGSNPMVWLCSGDFVVDGELTVRGGDGARVTTLNSANFPKPGGAGTCGGGSGGAGSPSGTARSAVGATGRGPLQVPGLGGRGGLLVCMAGCYQGDGGGSGGGGGSLATQGDPHYRAPAMAGTAFQQRRGNGGMGCSGGAGTRTGVLEGGAAGPLVFVDGRADNDFWGAGVDAHRNLRIVGELHAPVGGAGGGGGGDRSDNGQCGLSDPAFANDNSGGGGGGGGGILIVKALGEIVVSSTGRIVADGGNGGGGEQSGSCNQGGGGGGGSGGMIVLMSARRIAIHAHGNQTRWNYAQSDYDFTISADGGVCTTGTFQGPVVHTKYPANGQAMTTGITYDSNPLGGMGGMGIVQLMAPPGDNSSDGTNTRFDDNIAVFRGGVEQFGAAKQAILAWRGFPGADGTFVDDAGVPTNIGDDEGDIRPAPILLPVPFGDRSRLRSKWLDTGSSVRRALASEDGEPRGIVTGGEAQVGPTWSFAGLGLTGGEPGFLAYVPAGSADVRPVYPTVVPAVAIASRSTKATYLGQPAYRIELAEPVLGTIPNRYSQYEAELLLESGVSAGGFRIFSHTDRELIVAPEGGLLSTAATRVQVRARFFGVYTNGRQGFGPARVPVGGSDLEPIANVRLGFAFHRDPQSGPAGRFPLDPQQFVHSFDDPGLLAWIAANGPPRYMQWDALFDTSFRANGAPSSIVSPGAPRPELRFLRIPFRF